MNTNNKMIIAMGAAAAAGAILGVLFAPEKGSELQKKIAEKGKDWLAELVTLIYQGSAVMDEANANRAVESESRA